ncbi:MAG: hypothetical protein RR614_07415 [Eubacterium sp.]
MKIERYKNIDDIPEHRDICVSAAKDMTLSAACTAKIIAKKRDGSQYLRGYIDDCTRRPK